MAAQSLVRRPGSRVFWKGSADRRSPAQWPDQVCWLQRAHNSAVECHLHTVEVVGSNPAVPTNSFNSLVSTLRAGFVALSGKCQSRRSSPAAPHDGYYLTSSALVAVSWMAFFWPDLSVTGRSQT